jgi:hypothetical protein
MFLHSRFEAVEFLHLRIERTILCQLVVRQEPYETSEPFIRTFTTLFPLEYVSYLEVKYIVELNAVAMKQLGGIHATIEHDLEDYLRAHEIENRSEVTRIVAFECKSVDEESGQAPFAVLVDDDAQVKKR